MKRWSSKKAEQDRKYYFAHKEERRKKYREYYKKNAEKLRLYARQYYIDNLEKAKASRRKTNKKYYEKYYNRKKLYNSNLWKEIRLKTMQVLGGVKCKKCGFDDYRALHIDHINGGGKKHKKSFSSNKTYHKYIMDNPQEFQVLCANCNFIKKSENKEIRIRKIE